MKVSYVIFLVGIILSFILGTMVFSDIGNSDHLMYGLVSNDVNDKIITLYFFIVIMQFFFGGIIFLFERGMKIEVNGPFSDDEFDLDKNDLNEAYLEEVRNRFNKDPLT